MKIYIYWDAQECFTSFEDARKYYEENCDPLTFNEFLADNFGSEEIFNFTEDERLSVMEEYKRELVVEVKNWLEYTCEIIEIETNVK